MRYGFAVAAFNVIALQETKEFITGIKNDPDKKNRYYKYFARWVAEGDMPEVMRGFLLSDDTLKQKIKQALQASFTEEHFQIFLPYLDKQDINSALEERESKIAENQILINTDNIINNLFSLHPSAFDNEMESAVSALSSGMLFEGDTCRKLKILETDSYKVVQGKLQAQIADPGEYFSHEIILSFLKVAETREILNLFGNAMKIDHADLVAECEQICQAFVHRLETTSEDQQSPLSKEELARLNQNLKNSKEFIKEKAFIDFTADFFASYFGSNDSVEKNNLLKKLFYFTFDQKRVHIDDDWINSTYRENPEQKGEVILDPQHRNRVFLHALTLPVDQWTTTFYETFSEILALLENSTDPKVMEEKSYSYPPAFIAQLRWLQNRYAYEVLGIGESLPLPDLVFPLLYYPYNIVQFGYMLQILSPQQIGLVLENLNTRLTQIIHSSVDFSILLSLLSRDQRTPVCKYYKPQLVHLLQTPNNFSGLLNRLNRNKIIVVCESLKNELLKIFTEDYFINFFGSLGAIQRTAVYESLQDQIPQIIKSISYFLTFINLTADLDIKDDFIERLQPHLPQLIETADDFAAIFRCLDPDQRTALFENVKNQLSPLITDTNALNTILRYLNPDQRKVVKVAYLNNQGCITRPDVVDALTIYSRIPLEFYQNVLKDGLKNYKQLNKKTRADIQIFSGHDQCVYFRPDIWISEDALRNEPIVGIKVDPKKVMIANQEIRTLFSLSREHDLNSMYLNSSITYDQFKVGYEKAKREKPIKFPYSDQNGFLVWLTYTEGEKKRYTAFCPEIAINIHCSIGPEMFSFVNEKFKKVSLGETQPLLTHASPISNLSISTKHENLLPLEEMKREVHQRESTTQSLDLERTLTDQNITTKKPVFSAPPKKIHSSSWRCSLFSCCSSDSASLETTIKKESAKSVALHNGENKTLNGMQSSISTLRTRPYR